MWPARFSSSSPPAFHDVPSSYYLLQEPTSFVEIGCVKSRSNGQPAIDPLDSKKLILGIYPLPYSRVVREEQIFPLTRVTRLDTPWLLTDMDLIRGVVAHELIGSIRWAPSPILMPFEQRHPSKDDCCFPPRYRTFYWLEGRWGSRKRMERGVTKRG